jgi:putative glutamine amidotransferase
MRPFIGITTSTHEREHEQIVNVASAVNLNYSLTIYAAGGMPVLLPNAAHPEDADGILSRLDGVIFSGGGDVDPALWGEAPHPNLGTVDRHRDSLEIALLHAALRRQLPVLGICRGIQVMTVALGGDLWQDIPSQVQENVGHYQRNARRESCHPVHLQPASPLAAILRSEAAAHDETVRIPVNSFHHQAARKHGTVLTPVAWSDDGLIEALMIPDLPFALGVQWHPEDMAATSHRQANLFAAFVQAAADYAGRK